MGLHVPGFGAFLCFGVALLMIAGIVLAIVISALNRKNSGPPPAFPVVLPDGPGQYRVTGVSRANKADTTWLCEAQSADNAKVKAELEGIIVTRVEKV